MVIQTASQSILHFYIMHTKSGTANVSLDLERPRLSNPREIQLEAQIELLKNALVMIDSLNDGAVG